MNNEAKIMDMFYRSETKPRIRERLISREQYLEFLEGQLEENRVLCVQGVEGVGVTTTLALFAKRHGSHCVSYFNNGWSRYLLNPRVIASSLQLQLEQETLWQKQSQRLMNIVKNNESVWISTKLFYIVGSLSLLSIITIAMEIAFYVYFHWIQ